MKQKTILKILTVIIVHALVFTNSGLVYSQQDYNPAHTTLSPLINLNSQDIQYAFFEKEHLSTVPLQRKIPFVFPAILQVDEITKTFMVQQAVRELIEVLEKMPTEMNENSIERIDNKFWGIILDVTEYSPNVGAIKIFGYLPHKSNIRVYHIPALELYVKVDNSNKKVLELTQRLFSLLNGNEIEMDYSRVITDRAHEIEFWDNWKTDYKDSANSYSVCSQSLYPEVIKMVKEIVTAQDLYSETIVDIFGGDGEFLRELFLELEIGFPSLNAWYHLIDFNGKGIKEAKERIGGLKKVSVWQKNLILYSDIEKIIKDKPTIVTAIGGLVKRVVTFKSSYHIARDVYKALPAGGYFILTGYKEPHLNAEILSSIGFEVLNKTLMTKTAEGTLVPYSFYVLRKKPHREEKTELPLHNLSRPDLDNILGIPRREPIPGINNLIMQAI